ncbi:pilus assembly protein PilP [Synechococcus sp. 1G10]|uniref:pilus assembly protein PilP n=1 Tax=Synechococcus sp. 1G10 TaxID=2025605 RepID=UPI00117F232A|nr:pilus assembly protein PilP [Synechococcus sp. 1G10]
MNQARTVTGLALLPLLLAAGLSGCGGTPTADLGSVPPPAPVAPGAAPTTPSNSAPASAAIAKAGFTPLPTVQQVEAAMPQGRLDPFAPLAVTRATRVTRDGGRPRAVVVQPPLTLPDGFRFQGVISSGGRPMALVQFGGQSGSLAVGDAGGRTTDLLPEAWGVASIDVLLGRLTLVSRQGQAKSQVVIAEL